eukprot:2270189-Lingulodinium_polyedra.AAC.1
MGDLPWSRLEAFAPPPTAVAPWAEECGREGAVLLAPAGLARRLGNSSCTTRVLRAQKLWVRGLLRGVELPAAGGPCDGPRRVDAVAVANQRQCLGSWGAGPET